MWGVWADDKGGSRMEDRYLLMSQQGEIMVTIV